MESIENPYGEVWRVELMNQNAPYPYTQLRRSLAANDGYTVVMVDARRFMQAVERARDGLVVPPVDKWEAKEVQRLSVFLDTITEEGIPVMPIVYVELIEQRKKHFFGLIPGGKENVAVVGFCNGRHRSRFLHWAGATSFPVETEKGMASLLEQWCGVRSVSESSNLLV